MNRSGWLRWPRCAGVAFAAIALVTGAALALATGCRREKATALSKTDAAPAPVASALPPADHLDSDELLEGTETALGLVLPSNIHRDAVFGDVVFASGPVDLRALTLYLRQRLAGGEVHPGDDSSVFEDVHVPGQEDRTLRINVERTRAGARLEVRDVTSHVPPLADERARWRRVGLTPEGRIADPTHLE